MKSFFGLENPFNYLLTYKYLKTIQNFYFDAYGFEAAVNNNPNTLQLKYALRKMLLRCSITSSKNANCTDFSDGNSTNIILVFCKRKHTTPLSKLSEGNFEDNQVNKQDATTTFTPQERMMAEHLDEAGHTEFIENILFYIGGYIVSKLLLKSLTYSACIGIVSCQVAQLLPKYLAMIFVALSAIQTSRLQHSRIS